MVLIAAHGGSAGACGFEIRRAWTGPVTGVLVVEVFSGVELPLACPVDSRYQAHVAIVPRATGHVVFTDAVTHAPLGHDSVS